MVFNQIKIDGHYAIRDKARGLLRVVIVSKTQEIYGNSGRESRRRVRYKEANLAEYAEGGGYVSGQPELEMDADELLGTWEEHQALIAQQKAAEEARAQLAQAVETARESTAAALVAAGFEVIRDRQGELAGWGDSIEVQVKPFPEQAHRRRR